MSNPPDYVSQNGRRAAIRSFVLNEMMRGGGWAGLVVFGIAFLLWAIYTLGLLLPDASKTAPPPMPFSALVAPAATA